MHNANTNIAMRQQYHNIIPNNYTESIVNHYASTTYMKERNIAIPPVITATDSSMNNKESSCSDNIFAK